jgi:hypothetical protein
MRRNQWHPPHPATAARDCPWQVCMPHQFVRKVNRAPCYTCRQFCPWPYRTSVDCFHQKRLSTHVHAKVHECPSNA